MARMEWLERGSRLHRGVQARSGEAKSIDGVRVQDVA